MDPYAHITAGSPRIISATDLAERAEEQRPHTGRMVRDAKLEAIDGAVRAHEAAHVAALGAAAAGGASFSYLIGPDGTRYAVGGSVRVTASPIPGDPEATIRRAKALIVAAYAVAMPSPADMRVAAEAYEMEMQAKRDIARDAEGVRAGTGNEAAAQAPEDRNDQARHEWFA